MKALLLAAGAGTRLRPATDDRPKPMVPILDEPAIAYSLRWLHRQGVRHVAINLSHHPEVLRQYVGDGSRFGLAVRYSLESTPLGTAGALRPLLDFFDDAGDFLVLYGDVLTDLDVVAMLALHSSRDADFTMAVTPSADPTSAGIVEFGRDGRISRFVEKPPADQVFSTWENGGVYLCGPAVLRYVTGSGELDFGHHVIPAMLADSRGLYAYPSKASFIDFGTPERLARARAWLGPHLQQNPVVSPN